MLNKFKKTNQYLSGFIRRIKVKGLFKVIGEIVEYNKRYYKLLNRNSVPVNFRSILFHTAMYTKICRIRPELSKEEVMKYIPFTITHGIYKKLKINRKEITYDKYVMYKRMLKAGIDIPKVYYVSDNEGYNIWNNNITLKVLKQISKKDKLIAKPRMANAGKGIHLYRGDEVLSNHIYQDVVYNHKKIIDFQKNTFLSTVRYIVYNNEEKLIHIFTKRI